MALVIGLAALTAQASETDMVRDIQRYCTACWRNARLDPRLWDDCTQEVCCRLLAKARAGELDLNQVLAEDTPERRELVRAIDMVRKRVQRTKRISRSTGHSTPASDLDQRHRNRLELGEILEAARQAVLTRPPGSDHRALDARLVGPRDRRRDEPARHPGQRREVQGASEARAPPERQPRRAGDRLARRGRKPAWRKAPSVELSSRRGRGIVIAIDHFGVNSNDASQKPPSRVKSARTSPPGIGQAMQTAGYVRPVRFLRLAAR